MIKLIKQFTAWLDGRTEMDLAFEALIKEKEMIIASKDREIEDLRARNRQLMKRK